MNIAEKYINNNINGWGGEKLAAKAWNMLKSSDSFKPLPKRYGSSEKRKVFLHLLVRQLLKRDVENIAQQIGDCVSWGARNAIEYLECAEILLGGDLEKYRPIYAPYLYGTGRVFVGKNQLGRGDGSLGSWQAEAVIKYGALASDEYGCPAYSGKVASDWGYNPGPPDKYVNIARLNPVKSASIVKNWDELVTAISNGYPCTIASDQGFSMAPDSEGFHRPQGKWMHQMCVCGIDQIYKYEYGLIRNSWGNVHGQLYDFNTNEKLPVGYLRVKRATIERMIQQGDTFAYSNFQGFPEQYPAIEKSLFKMI